jgi:hypothetical protein
MDRTSALFFLTICFLIYTNVALSQDKETEWNIKLYPISTASDAVIEMRKDFIKIEFVGYNKDQRSMYNTQVEFFLPDVVDYYPQAKYIVVPTVDVILSDHYVRWDNIEQHIVGLAKKGALSCNEGWWCIVNIWGVKPGTGGVTAKLSWEDETGNKYSRVYPLKTVTVIGKEQLPISIEPSRKLEVKVEENLGPKVRIVIFDKSQERVTFYLDADDREMDNINGYQWKIDEQDFSDWMNEYVITVDLMPGEHTILARAKDDKGNEGEISEKKVEIEKSKEIEIEENQGPIVKVSKTSYPYPDNPFIIRFELSAADKEDDEISGFRWNIDEQEWSGWGDGIIITDTLTLGKHLLSTQAKDDKGNEGEVREWEFEMDNGQGPIVTIDKLSYLNPNFPSQGIKFQLNAEDKESDKIAGFSWRLDEQPWSDWKDRDVTIKDLAAGRHIIYAKAKDDKSNESEVIQREFIIGKSGLYTGFNLGRGKTATLGAGIKGAYEAGWEYEAYGEYNFPSQLSVSISLGFQKYNAKQNDNGHFKLFPMYVSVKFPLFKVSSRFRLNPFLSAGLNLYRFAGLKDYNDTTTYGIEMGMITEYDINPSLNSSGKANLTLQAGVNYTYSNFPLTFTSLIFGVKSRL